VGRDVICLLTIVTAAALQSRGVNALGVVLAMGLGLLASPAAAAPFAYVTNAVDDTVSVIDTATNMVAGTPIPVGSQPNGVAVTPDGKHAYVANVSSANVSVIDTATNKVVGTPIVVGNFPECVAVTPDGTHAYVTTASTTVPVIDTASETVVATVAVGSNSIGVAITPDGKHVYVTNLLSNNVSVIDTSTNPDPLRLRSRWGVSPVQ
jgi:YVTN family beta-propeller protein